MNQKSYGSKSITEYIRVPAVLNYFFNYNYLSYYFPNNSKT